jgi:hypothetical protein
VEELSEVVDAKMGKKMNGEAVILAGVMGVV